ncbi:hypothetical protein HPB52_012134 [Rhipicephalus sanguineus]|uniref:Glucosamine 6-phosphate N-acetyltransferase n=1 Tax=Rhipicephalus sanguineus TaxID=34632 RepID=A0A9D4QAH9_RHISA|nr:hypothetical protein HPB52_012134 [Rhipicephalus sanguineus]
MRIYAVLQAYSPGDLHALITSHSHNGQHAAVKLSSGLVVMAMYLAPNLSKGDVAKYIEKAMHRYSTEFKHGPFVLVGDLNVDIMQYRFRAMKAAPGTYYVTVIEDADRGAVVASATLFTELKFIRGLATRGHIEDVVVSSEYRGRNLGKL